MLGISGVKADGLKVSTTESASAEYQYKIFCRNASTYYLGNTTNATNSGADYGLFTSTAYSMESGFLTMLRLVMKMEIEAKTKYL